MGRTDGHHAVSDGLEVVSQWESITKPKVGRIRGAQELLRRPVQEVMEVESLTVRREHGFADGRGKVGLLSPYWFCLGLGLRVLSFWWHCVAVTFELFVDAAAADGFFFVTFHTSNPRYHVSL